MPPKGKGAGGTRQVGDGNEPDLVHFQELFSKAIQAPDLLSKKGSIMADLERFSNAGNSQISRLAKLCRARLQYGLYVKDQTAQKSLREDAEARLTSLFEETPASMTALCLKAAFVARGSQHGEHWSAIADVLQVLQKRADPSSLDERDWIDPAEEAINNTSQKESFEDFKDCQTKLERLKEMAKYVQKESQKAVKQAEEHRRRQQQATTTASGPRYAAQNGQQTAEAREEGNARSGPSVVNKAIEHLEERKKLANDLSSIMDLIGRKLKEEGATDPESRMKALCELLGADQATYAAELSKLVGELGNDVPLQPQHIVPIKTMIQQKLAAQMDRFRANGELLQLKQANVKGMLEATYKGEGATGAEVAAACKDDKGDVSSGPGKGGASKKGASKAGVRDQDKRPAAAPQPEAGCALPLKNTKDFLDWFVKVLKEQGPDFRSRVVAAAEPGIVSDGRAEGGKSEMRAIRTYCEKAPSLADVLLLRCGESSAAANAPSGVHQEVVKRTRFGELLITAPVDGDKNPSLDLVKKGALYNKLVEERNLEIARFTTCLQGLQVLQQHDVISTLADNFVMLASFKADKSLGATVQPRRQMLPNSPQEVLDNIGDPVCYLMGYVNLLRRRGVVPLKKPVQLGDGIDVTEARLRRLCDWCYRNQQRHANELILLATHLHESTEKEHVDILQRVYGELPLVLAKRARAATAKAQRGASAMPNGGGADAKGEQPGDIETGDAKEAESEEEALAFLGPFFEFDIRTDLPDWERNAVDDSMRTDIMDAVAALQEDGCGLGRCVSTSLKKYISEALGEPYANVSLEQKELRSRVEKLDTEQLVHLRLFLLSQLCARSDGALISMQDRVAEYEREAREEMWGVEVIKDDQGVERIQLSQAAYLNFYRRWRMRRRKYNRRLQVLHALKPHVQESKPAGLAGGSAAPTSAVSAAATAGVKKKGKGGGGAGGAGGGTATGAAAVAANEQTPTLPPLPDEVPPLEGVDLSLLKDFYLYPDEAALVFMLTREDLICSYEVLEALRDILDPPEDYAPLGQDAGACMRVPLPPPGDYNDACVVEEILRNYSGTQTACNQFEAASPYTLTEVVEDLARASLLEALRQETQEKLEGKMKQLLGASAGLLKHFGEKGMKDQVMETLRPYVSSWLLEKLEEAEPSEHAKVAELVGRIEAVKKELSAEAFTMHSRVVRLSVLHFVARVNGYKVLEEKLEQLEAQCRQAPSQSQAGRGAGKQNKPRSNDDGNKLTDVERELKTIKLEKQFVESMRDSAFEYSDELLGYAKEAIDPYSTVPLGMRGEGSIGETPQAAAGAILLALQAAQHLTFNVMVIERVVEQMALQARAFMATALLSDPVLDAGIIGMPQPIQWLRNKLFEMREEWLINGDSETKKAREAKAAKERERKQAELRKKEADRKREEEEARKRAEEEEEERLRAEREAQEARDRDARAAAERREREEREAAEARKAEEESKKSQSRMRSVLMEMEYFITPDQFDALKDEEAAPAEAKASDERAKGHHHGGKGGAVAGAGGKKEAMSGRLKEKDLQKQSQPAQHAADGKGKRDGAAGPLGGPGGGKGDVPQRKGGPGPGQQQQQQSQGGHGQQGPPQAKPRDNPPFGAAGEAAGAASGRDAGAKPGPVPQPAPGGGHGKGDRGGQPGGGAGAQQPHVGKGGQGGKGGGGSGPVSKPAPATPAPAQPGHPRIVPGFDPEAHHAADGKQPRQRKGRRGGGGAGEVSSASAAASASGRSAADRRSSALGGVGLDDEHPHPPAADADGEEVHMVDLTEPEAPASGDVAMDQYPLIVPYPFAPPEGWMVHRGYLFPADTDPDALAEEGVVSQGLEREPETVESFMQFYLAFLAGGYLKERNMLPFLPREVFKGYAPQDDEQQQGQQPRQLPYAVPAAVPADYGHQDGRAGAVGPAGETAAGPPYTGAPAPHPTVPGIPPYEPGATPGAPWGGYSPIGVPPFLPPFLRPPGVMGVPPGPAAAPPGPYSAGPPMYPLYGVQPVVSQAPVAHVPGPTEARGGESESDQEDTDDLLGLLGVQSQSQPQGPRAAPPAQLPPPPMPMFPPYGGFPGHPLQPPFAAQPPGMPPPPQAHQQPSNDMEPGIVLQSALGARPPPMAAAAASTPAYMPPVQQHPQARAPPASSSAPPAGPPAMSWAQRVGAAAAAKAAAAAVGRSAASRPRATGDSGLDSEEQQLQAAVHQSMRDNMNVAFPPLGAGAHAGVPPPPAAGGQELALVPGGAVGTGLVNRVGEYNCFLNVIIQCLWHCAAFRHQLRSHDPGEFEGEHPVVAALLRLFQALDLADTAREQQRQQLSNSEVAVERHVVDPSELREALDALGVRAGEMNDASEVLGALFDQLNHAPGLSGEGTVSVVDRTFGLQLSEEVRCTDSGCSRITHVVQKHFEYFFITTATGLRDTPAVIEEANPSMGRVIREIEYQNYKRCDSDPPHFGCNQPMRVTRTLHNVPAVLTVLLAWEPDVPSEAIAGTLRVVDTVLDPKEFIAVEDYETPMPTYALHGMFCYYGQHYFAFINRGPVEPESAQEWVMFDDATVASVGNWAAVISKCRAGRIQPSVLFYQQYR